MDLLTGATLTLAEAGAEGGAHGSSSANLYFYVALTLGVMFLVMTLGKKGIRPGVFRSRLSGAFEQLYLFIENMCVGTIGAHGRKYIPMVMTFWMLIFTANMIGLFFPSTPTAILSFNLGMALVSIGYVQYEGIKSNGLVGHFRHFAGPKLPIFMIPVTLMIFLIEIISEVMKNVSLPLRLYGNINGGHQAVEAMNALGHSIYIPFGTFLLPIKILTVIVQALIFTLLTCVYLSLVTHHEGDEGEHAHSDSGQEMAATF